MPAYAPRATAGHGVRSTWMHAWICLQIYLTALMVELAWMALDTVLHAGKAFTLLLYTRAAYHYLLLQVTYSFKSAYIQSLFNSHPYGGMPIPVCFLPN